MLRRRTDSAAPSRRGIILLVVLFLLTLFAIVGLSLVLYADAEATAARAYRDGHFETRPEVEPELLFSFFLGQLLYDLPDDERGVFSALRGHSLSRSMYGLDCTFAPDGTLLPASNDTPYNGSGRLHFPSVFPALDDYHLINYTYHRNDGFLRDPERPGARPGPRPAGGADNRRPYAGGFNAPYTYPDLNNTFLAAAKAGPTILPNGTRLPEGLLLMPSFHRPWLFGRLTDVPNFPAGNPGNPNWTNPEGKYLLLRPRPIDMGPGFPYPEDEGGDVKNLIGGPGYYDPLTGRIHQNDSVWLDLDAPVLTAKDGRKYKALFAPLILDLDNRINVNVHGNLRGSNFADHASNMGWGPWEVNLGRVLDRSPAEWQSLLRGDRFGGRYGLDSWPHSSLPGNVALAGAASRFYAPADMDGSQELAAGRPTEQLRLPGTLPSLPYQCFPAPAAGYGNNSVQERLAHPLLYHPFRPTPPDRAFGLSNMEALLRQGDTGSSALTGDLLKLCPKNLSDPIDPQGCARRRRLVTVQSYDLDRPGVSPWFWPSSRDAYSRLDPSSPTTTSLYPSGGSPQPLPQYLPHPDSEYGPDGRAVPTLTGLRRLNLNRYLPDYPAVGAGGRMTDPARFTVAQVARQHLAAEVFERLWRTTGAGNPYLPTVFPPPGAPGFDIERWEALRWLAQLAVNIVDFIDADDVMTPFNWFPPYPGNPGGEIVFGTELPRVVLNEAYVEYANDPTDRGLNDDPPAARQLKGNVWVELYNTSRDDPPLTAPWRKGTATLEVPESRPGAGDGYGAYNLIIASMGADLRQPGNVRGEIAYGGPLSMLSRFSPEPGGPASPIDTREIAPANAANAGGYFGNAGENQGFYVLGPRLDPLVEQDPFPPLGAGRPLATLSRSEMSYRIPAVDPAIYSLMQPSILLQRLACPYLPPNPLPGLAVDPSQPYNPYITVDYIYKVSPHYAAAVGTLGPNSSMPTPITQRFSQGRKQPYGGHRSLQKPQQSQPPHPDQPQHTWFQHNADSDTPGPNWRLPPASYPPFDWLVHLDRPLVSPGELLQVSAYKPHELLQEFLNPSGKLKPYNHRAPWFDEDLTAASGAKSRRLYRVLEFLATHNPSLGTATAGTVSVGAVAAGANQVVQPLAIAGLTSTGGNWQIEAGASLVIDRGLPGEEVIRVKAVVPRSAAQPARFLADFLRPHPAGFAIQLTTVSERLPGKINLNTVWDEEVLQALCDAQPSNSFHAGMVATMFRQLKASRTVGGEWPGPDDRPFLGLASGPTSGSDPRQLSGGLKDTLLRSITPDGEPILSVPVLAHPFQRYELLTKIFNLTTTRSNVFAVWLTVGFFEVFDETERPVRLGAEIGRAENRQIRHRMFGIVDRSTLLRNPGPQEGFDPRASRSPGAAGKVVPYLSVID